MRTALFLAALFYFLLILPAYFELNCLPEVCNIKHGMFRADLLYQQQSEAWQKYQDRLGHGGALQKWAPLHTGR